MHLGCSGQRNIQLGCLTHGSLHHHKPARRSSSRLPPSLCRHVGQQYCQLRQRRFKCQAASDFAAPAPGAPVAGDNHGALIHQLLNDHSDEVEAYVREGLQEALDEAQNGKSRPAVGNPERAGSMDAQQDTAGSPGPEDPKQFIPHRWRIIAMMSLAFILCNMDKVQFSLGLY